MSCKEIYCACCGLRALDLEALLFIGDVKVVRRDLETRTLTIACPKCEGLISLEK